MSKYIPVIGMEIHVELKTKSKMFRGCANGMGEGKNTKQKYLSSLTAQPGALPVPNQKAIEFVQKAGLALNCELARNSKFDRKNYFYPDLPKGYQISQFDMPLCENGFLEIQLDGGKKKIGITRIHMEEDTGKSSHPAGTNYSLVDLNRSGVPLMELVTEPDIESGKEARLICQKLQQVFGYLNISDADMEKGQMRCEVNISLHKENEEKLSGHKVEIKNLNSFKVLFLAMADPLNVLAIDDVRRITKMEVSPLIAPEKTIIDKLHQLDSSKTASMEHIILDAHKHGELEVDAENLETVKETVEEVNLDALANSADEAPVIRLANLILVQAIKDRASDIHIEPFEKELRLRYRVDGALLDKTAPPKTVQVALISRLIIMSCLDIAERRLPQDGRMRVKVSSRD